MVIRLSLSRSSAIAFALAALCSARAGQAQADVIAIDDQGNTMLRSSGGAVDWIASPPDANPGDGAAIPAGALTPAAGPAAPAAFGDALNRAAAAAGISPALLAAVVWQESRWRAAAVSPKGAVGLGQLMPDTARRLGVDPRDPGANLLGAARYLRTLLDRFDNNLELALAAYNAGPGRVARAAGVPRIAETQAYVAQVTARLGRASRTP
jgi:soluble lytic murein transglycosylase-like protein